MKERVAIATVQGKVYFLIVNELREQNIPFVSLVPGEPVPDSVRLVITTEQEKNLVKHEKILVFRGEGELDNLIGEVKRILLGKEAFEKVVIGIDPGEATGLAVVADGKVIEEGNCYSTQEVISTITKTIKNVNFSQTAVSVKIGNGVPVYKELLEALDQALPLQVALEVVGEAGTNKPLKENGHSRGIRHISSAIRIAGRTGHIVSRRKTIAANSRIQ
jgi:transcriptional accessory protein Tex/SPT6